MMRIFIAGDSTAANKEPSARPESGWGEHLEKLLPEGIQVCNYAKNGCSSKSFIDEGRLEVIERELRPNDCLLIQFGHNDGKIEDPTRYAAADGAYCDNLETFIRVARRCAAFPVLLTSVSRRSFSDGVLQENTVGAYPSAMAQVARQEGIPLLDLYTMTWQMYRALGDEKSKEIFVEGDNTHFNEAGAEQVAAMVVSALEPMFTGEI